jgi:hypothetical protein
MSDPSRVGEDVDRTFNDRVDGALKVIVKP